MTRTEHEPQQMHAAHSRPVGNRRAKYRDEEQFNPPSNIMFDRRVVRGNTYAAQVLAAEPHILEAHTSSLRKSVRKKAIPATPQPVEGRLHADIQTDSYLEELVDVVPEAEESTQTDPFIDRPITPLFVPQKSGVDAATQILQGDLFDFDYEVEPILEVLVGKILEQGLMEVMEEEELSAMREHQEQMEQVRNAELVATQRMETAEIRKQEEKDRRIAQERERLKAEAVVREKVAASAFSRGYLNGLVDTVFDKLQKDGFFYDPVKREIENDFMPWLRKATEAGLKKQITIRSIVGSVVKDAVILLKNRKEEAAANIKAEAETTRLFAEKEEAAITDFKNTISKEIETKASFILNNLVHQLAEPETIKAIREELEAKAKEDAMQIWTDSKAKIEEEAKAKYREGKEEDEINEEEEAAAVGLAIAALPDAQPTEVSDQDVVSALLDKEIITKEKITRALAVDGLGNMAYTNRAQQSQDKET